MLLHIFVKTMINYHSEMWGKDAFNWLNIYIMLQKISVSNERCSFELFIHQRIMEKKSHSFHNISDYNQKSFLSSKSAY